MSLEKFKQQLQRGGTKRLKINLKTYRALVRRYWNLKTKLRNPINKRTGKPLAEGSVHSYRASLKSYDAYLDVSNYMIRAQVRRKRKGGRPKLKLIQGGKAD